MRAQVAESATDIALQCGNGADMGVFRERHGSLQGEIQSCLLRCVVGGAACAADCIVADVGLSLAPSADLFVRRRRAPPTPEGSPPASAPGLRRRVSSAVPPGSADEACLAGYA